MNSPHNGRNITIEMFGKAINSAIGWSSSVGVIPATGAFKALGVDAALTIDLEQLINRPVGLERLPPWRALTTATLWFLLAFKRC